MSNKPYYPEYDPVNNWFSEKIESIQNELSCKEQVARILLVDDDDNMHKIFESVAKKELGSKFTWFSSWEALMDYLWVDIMRDLITFVEQNNWTCYSHASIEMFMNSIDSNMRRLLIEYFKKEEKIAPFLNEKHRTQIVSLLHQASAHELIHIIEAISWINLIKDVEKVESYVLFMDKILPWKTQNNAGSGNDRYVMINWKHYIDEYPIWDINYALISAHLNAEDKKDMKNNRATSIEKSKLTTDSIIHFVKRSLPRIFW